MVGHLMTFSSWICSHHKDSKWGAGWVTSDKHSKHETLWIIIFFQYPLFTMSTRRGRMVVYRIHCIQTQGRLHIKFIKQAFSIWYHSSFQVVPSVMLGGLGCVSPSTLKVDIWPSTSHLTWRWQTIWQWRKRQLFCLSFHCVSNKYIP